MKPPSTHTRPASTSINPSERTRDGTYKSLPHWTFRIAAQNIRMFWPIRTSKTSGTSETAWMPETDWTFEAPRMSIPSRMSALPHFVVLEGLDGCGKSSLAAALAETLGATLLSTPLPELASIRDEVDRVFGERGLARTLWYAAQVAAASEQARRLLDQGRRVVLDRYWMSTLAYAEGQGTSLELPEVLRSLTVPDVTLLIDLPHALRVHRLNKRREALKSHDREFITTAAEERLFRIYRSLGRHPAAGRFHEVALEDETVEQDLERVLRVLQSTSDDVNNVLSAKVLHTLEVPQEVAQ